MRLSVVHVERGGGERRLWQRSELQRRGGAHHLEHLVDPGRSPDIVDRQRPALVDDGQRTGVAAIRCAEEGHRVALTGQASDPASVGRITCQRPGFGRTRHRLAHVGLVLGPGDAQPVSVNGDPRRFVRRRQHLHGAVLGQDPQLQPLDQHLRINRLDPQHHRHRLAPPGSRRDQHQPPAEIPIDDLLIGHVQRLPHLAPGGVPSLIRMDLEHQAHDRLIGKRLTPVRQVVDLNEGPRRGGQPLIRLIVLRHGRRAQRHQQQQQRQQWLRQRSRRPRRAWHGAALRWRGVHRGGAGDETGIGSHWGASGGAGTPNMRSACSAVSIRCVSRTAATN